MNQDQGRACGDWILRDICNDQANAVYENMEQIKNAAETLKAIQAEVSNVRADMYSMSVSYIKYKLWRLENSMNSSGCYRGKLCRK